MLPQAATKTRNDTELQESPLLCRQKGRQTSPSSDKPTVRPARLPDGRPARHPENRYRPTNRSEGKRFLKVLTDNAIPCHLLPQAATKGGNGTGSQKCPLLCEQNGRLVSPLSEIPAIRPAGLSDFRLASLPDSRRAGRPTSWLNCRLAGMLTDKPTGRTDCRPDNRLLTT